MLDTAAKIIEVLAQVNWTYLIGIAVGMLNMGYIVTRKGERWHVKETLTVLALHLAGRVLVEIIANA